MTSRAHAGIHLAAVVVAVAVAVAGCSAANKPAPQPPVAAGVKFEPPRRKKMMHPPFPETLRRQGIEADVPVMVSLDEAGNVVKVKLVNESRYPELNEAVRKTAMAEEFTPATRDGVPIAYSVSFTYRFRVEGE